jgi:hypothetical protein
VVFQKNFKGEEKVKKLIGFLTMMILLPAVLLVGCNTEKGNPSSPAGPTATPTVTGTPPTATASPTITSTPLATATAQVVQTPVNLNSAAGFAVLASTTITNSGPTTICGNLGLSPGTAVTGAPVLSCGGVLHVNDTTAATAEGDLTTAYNDAAGRTTPALLAGNLGGLTLYPGLYKSTSSLAISSGDLTLDAQGNANAVFIFQIASTLIISPARQVILAGGAQAANIFWQVGTSCALGTTVNFKGIIMAHDQITFDTGAMLEGRALSQIAQVTFLTSTITNP